MYSGNMPEVLQGTMAQGVHCTGTVALVCLTETHGEMVTPGGTARAAPTPPISVSHFSCCAFLQPIWRAAAWRGGRGSEAIRRGGGRQVARWQACRMQIQPLWLACGVIRRACGAVGNSVGDGHPSPRQGWGAWPAGPFGGGACLILASHFYGTCPCRPSSRLSFVIFLSSLPALHGHP